MHVNTDGFAKSDQSVTLLFSEKCKIWITCLIKCGGVVSAVLFIEEKMIYGTVKGDSGGRVDTCLAFSLFLFFLKSETEKSSYLSIAEEERLAIFLTYCFGLPVSKTKCKHADIYSQCNYGYSLYFSQFLVCC